MKKARILLVEDETEVLAANRDYFEEKGYEVSCAETLHEARNRFWEYPPDVILLDVLLPDGSGYDFCREVRKKSSVPIIFLTCMCEDGSIVTGLELGGDDYIVKPYSLSVLHARVTAQLRRRGAGTGEIILPPLYINLTSGVVKLENETVELGRKEFQLLVYFAENRGQELAQSQIYEAVWNAPAESMGNTVRMNVSRLRQKLRINDGSAFELSATPNQGYIFMRVLYSD